MLVFSSTHITTACSGGFMYSPTTSRTLSTNCGSSDSLNVSVSHGFNPNARQIRPTRPGTPSSAVSGSRPSCASAPAANDSVHEPRRNITPFGIPVVPPVSSRKMSSGERAMRGIGSWASISSS